MKRKNSCYLQKNYKVDMIIYNVTVNIDESIHDEWLLWIKEHIPQVLATGKFKEAKLTKVLVEEEMGGQTYSIQYRAHSREMLDAYYKEDDPILSDAIFDVNQTIIVSGQNNDLDVISDDVYYYILDGKAYFKDFTRAPWYIKLLKHNDILKEISA